MFQGCLKVQVTDSVVVLAVLLHTHSGGLSLSWWSVQQHMLPCLELAQWASCHGPPSTR
jgi:hypothetical protein